MEHPKWFAVIVNNDNKSLWTFNYKIEKHEGFASDIKCLFWLRVSDSGKINRTKTPNEYNIYDYDLFDSSKRKFILNIKGWKLLELRDFPWKNSFEPGYCIIADPWGKERNTTIIQRDEEIVLTALSILEKTSEHDSWETYDIKMEMEELKEELEELRKLVEKLKP